MRIPKWPALVLSFLLVFAVGAIGSLATSAHIESWYAPLQKATLTPPDWVFGPAWTLLYILMAVAAWRIYIKSPQPGTRTALGMYGLQLGLNLLWSLVFFGLKSPLGGLVVIVFLGLSILLTIRSFNRVDRSAALLLVPYLAWVLFASFLNLSVVLLN